jgi:hypothetical protein
MPTQGRVLDNIRDATVLQAWVKAMAKTPKSQPPTPDEPTPDEPTPIQDPATNSASSSVSNQDTDSSIVSPGTAGVAQDSIPDDLANEVTLTTSRTNLRLDQIDRTTLKHVYCHRDTAELTTGNTKPTAPPGSSMRSLVESIVSEGQITPIEFYRDTAGNAILVSGYRIVEAHYQIIGKKLDPARFARDMAIPAVELTGGAEVDYLLRAVASNEVRLSLSDDFRYTVAAMLLERKVPATRAARAMGVSGTVFNRYIRRYDNKWIINHVKDDYLSQTEADTLLEAAAVKDAIVALKQALDTVFIRIRNYIAWLKVQAKANREKLPTKAILPKTYVKQAKVVKLILECLKEGKPLKVELGLGEVPSHPAEATQPGAVGASSAGQPADTTIAPAVPGDDFTFECKVDEKDGKLRVSGLNGVALSRLSHEALAAIACKLNILAEDVTNLYKTKQAAQTMMEAKQTSTLARKIAFLESIGAWVQVNELKSQIAPAGNGKGNGTPVPRTVQPIADTLNVPAKPQ